MKIMFGYFQLENFSIEIFLFQNLKNGTISLLKNMELTC